MTPIRILISFILLFVGINVSAQQISTLAIGKNAKFGVKEVTYGIAYIKGSVEDNLVVKQITYTPTAEEFEVFIRRKFSELDVTPRPGMEDADYLIYVQTDWSLQFAGWDKVFKLEKTATGWKLPESAVNFELDTGFGGWDIPTATDIEVTTVNGDSLSTITRENDLASLCSLPVVESGLDRGRVGLGSPFGSKGYKVATFTIYEGLRFVTFNGDGVPMEWSEPAPSFFKAPVPPPPAQPERRPLMVNIRLEGKLPVLMVSGDGAELAVIEQSRDGLRWGPAISLSSPARKSSLNEGEYLFEFEQDSSSTGDTAIFYRARTTVSQNN